MEGNLCFLTASDESAEIICVCAVLAVPDRHCHFRRAVSFSSIKQWWLLEPNQRRRSFFPCFFLRSCPAAANCSQSHHGQEDRVGIGHTNHPRETAERNLSWRRVTIRIFYVFLETSLPDANVYKERPRQSILLERGKGILRLE